MKVLNYSSRSAVIWGINYGERMEVGDYIFGKVLSVVIFCFRERP